MPSRRPKVLYLINDLLLGGTQSILLDIISSLDRESIDVELWYLDGRKGKNNDRPDCVEKFRALGVEPRNLHIRSIGTGILRLARELRKERPDVVHACLPNAVIIGTFAARLAGISAVLIHEQNTHKFYSKRLDKLFEFARKFASVTIAYSETLEQELFGDFRVLQEPITLIDRRSYTIYNGINMQRVEETKKAIDRDKKRAELGIKPDEVLVFTAARLIDWKGHDFLIRAFARVVRKYPNARLVIAGGGDMQAKLRGLIREQNLDDTARLIGSRTDVFEILAVSDIYPQAYAYPEGFSSISIGMAGMEAMAFALPIVVSDYPALYHGIEHKKNALIVQPRDVDGLTEVLCWLIEHESERREIGARARQFVERYFTSERSAAIYESIYKSLAVL